jgi:hypothetical protein
MRLNVLRFGSLLAFLVMAVGLFASSSEPEDSTLNKSRLFAWRFNHETFVFRFRFSVAEYRALKGTGTQWNKTTNKWEYEKIVEESTQAPYMERLAEAIDSICYENDFSPKQEADLVVSFVQSLDYLYDPDGGATQYVKYPLETLVDGGGDCEDTAILMAALLKMMGYRCILLNPPGHIAVGIWTGSKGGNYKFNGETYHFVESTSKGWKVGQVPAEFLGKDCQVYDLTGGTQMGLKDLMNQPGITIIEVGEVEVTEHYSTELGAKVAYRLQHVRYRDAQGVEWVGKVMLDADASYPQR